MYQFVYPANVQKGSDGFYLVTFPDIGFAKTDGKSLPEALKEARDCLAEAIAICIDDGLDIPAPSVAKKGAYQITVPALMAAKAALYLAVREQGITKVGLAEKLSVDEKEVRRMLSPKHPTKISRIEKALQVMGKKLIITLDAA